MATNVRYQASKERAKDFTVPLSGLTALENAHLLMQNSNPTPINLGRQTTASKITIKLNQHLWEGVLDCISFG